MPTFLEIDRGTGYETVACLLEWSEAEDTEMVGTTTRQNGGWRTSLGLVQGLAVSGSGVVPKDQALLSWEAMTALKRARTIFNFRIDTDEYTGIITELTLDASGDQDLGFTFKILLAEVPPALAPDPPDPGGAPSGYSVAWVNDPFDLNNYTQARFSISGAEIGATYNYTISSTGGGTPIAGSGTVSVSPFETTEDISTLGDGTITVEVTLTNGNGTGSPVTDTATLDTTPAPSGYALAWDNDPILSDTAAALTLTAGNGEGTSLSGVITSSGGGSPVNVNESFVSTPYGFTVNVSSLPNGTLSANITVLGPGGTQTITPPPTTTKN